MEATFRSPSFTVNLLDLDRDFVQVPSQLQTVAEAVLHPVDLRQVCHWLAQFDKDVEITAEASGTITFAAKSSMITARYTWCAKSPFRIAVSSTYQGTFPLRHLCALDFGGSGLVELRLAAGFAPMSLEFRPWRHAAKVQLFLSPLVP